MEVLKFGGLKRIKKQQKANLKNETVIKENLEMDCGVSKEDSYKEGCFIHVPLFLPFQIMKAKIRA